MAESADAGSAGLRILCVGDVHECWDAGDESAVRALRPDALLFVGDYGDESVSMVAAIAECGAALERDGVCRVLAVLGNHEAVRHGLYPDRARREDEATRNRVLAQMKLLRRFNPAFGRFALDAGAGCAPVSVIAGRPFSWGGPEFGRFAHIYQNFLDISTMEQSTARIVRDIRASPEGNPLLFLSHNGPLGLGSRPADPCGNDYEPGEADKGDPDLRDAITEARRAGRRVPLVVFGHFHRAMRGGLGVRTMVVSEPDGPGPNAKTTVMVNCAFVPRHRVASGGKQRHFMLVSCDRSNDVTAVDAIWVASDGTVRESKNYFTAN